MGNPVIAMPTLGDAATLTGSSAATGMPVANLQGRQPGQVWRGLDPAGAWIEADLGADPTTALDSSRSRNNGALFGGYGYVAGELGRPALRLDGAVGSGYAEVGDVLDFLGTANFTLEAIVTPRSATSDNLRIFSKEQITPQREGWLLGYKGDDEEFLFLRYEGGAGSTATSVSAPRGIRYHVAAVHDYPAHTVYVDGIAGAADSVPRSLVGHADPLRLGRRSDGSFYFDGDLQELRIWDRALTVAEIQANRNVSLTGNEPGLVGYWKFGDREPVNLVGLLHHNLGRDGTWRVRASGGDVTNKCENFNLAPTDLTGIVKGGDAAATLTVVDDSKELGKAGLSNKVPAGMVYKLDNSAGVAAAYAEPNGTVGNTNVHTVTAYARHTGATGVDNVLRINGQPAGATAIAADADYSRYDAIQTPADSARLLQVRAHPGAIIYFILNQLEERGAPSGIREVAGAAATSRWAVIDQDLDAFGGYDSGQMLAWPSNDLDDWDTRSSTLWLDRPAGPGPQVFRYWRVDAADPDNPAGYLEAGRLYLSNAWQASRNVEYGWATAWLDPTEIGAALGGQEYDIGRRRRRQLTFGVPIVANSQAEAEAEAYGKAFDLQRLRGLSGDVLAIRDPDNAEQLQRQSVYGRFSELRPISNTVFKTFTTRFAIREMLP